MRLVAATMAWSIDQHELKAVLETRGIPGVPPSFTGASQAVIQQDRRTSPFDLVVGAQCAAGCEWRGSAPLLTRCDPGKANAARRPRRCILPCTNSAPLRRDARP